MTLGFILLSLPQAQADGSRLVRQSLATDLVAAGSVDYAVLLPEGYSQDAERMPLALMLHGAGGSREQLARFAPQIRQMWAAGELPRLVVATPSVASGSIYMDSYDGTDRWETFVMSEFLPHLRTEYRVRADRTTTMVTGISMGGFGSLRLGFKYPDVFGAVAAMEPGAWPGVTWDEIPDRNKIRPPERIAKLFGHPFDHGRFERENPASIVDADPSRLKELAIYLEVGDEDGFGFVEGVEFMHRLLWRHRIPHEYRLVRWADHVGSTLMERSRDRFRFLARYLGRQRRHDPATVSFRERMADTHESRGMEPFGYWPNSTLRSYSSGDAAADQARAARDSEEVRKERAVLRVSDVPYVGGEIAGSMRQSLDIYMREGLAEAPVVLYVHGGGWVRGGKERALFKPTTFVPEGYLFVSMNYRLHPEASVKGMAGDVARAIAWLKLHVAKYRGDPSRIVLMGHSAGGHLAALVASNPEFMDAVGGSLHDLGGAVILDSGMLHVPLRMKTAGRSQYRVFGRDPAAWIPVSPWHHVKAGQGIPPFMLLTADGRAVTSVQAQEMQDRLRSAGIEAEIHEARGRAHMPLDTYIGVDGDESTRMILRFLERLGNAGLRSDR